MFCDDVHVFYPSDAFPDYFLVPAGGEVMKTQLQIKKQRLRNAALSPREKTANHIRPASSSIQGWNNCCDTLLMHIILNIHSLLPPGIIVLKKRFKGVFLFSVGFSTELKSSVAMRFESYFCV